MKSPHQTLYRCPDGIVEVHRKSTGLHRFPPSDYACVLFVLKPQEESRVRILPDGKVEFMPNYDELKAMIGGIAPSVLSKLPADFCNKPRHRQQKYQYWNKIRAQQKGGRR